MDSQVQEYKTRFQGSRINSIRWLVGSIATYFQARKDLDRLAEMSDQSLEDIGITRSEINEHKSKLFLRVFH